MKKGSGLRPELRHAASVLLDRDNAAATSFEVIKPKIGAEPTAICCRFSAVVFRVDSRVAMVIDGSLWLCKVTGPSIYVVYLIKETRKNLTYKCYPHKISLVAVHSVFTPSDSDERSSSLGG